MKFESIISLATYSLVSMLMEQVVNAILKCETRQRRFVADMSLHANLMQHSSETVEPVKSREDKDPKVPSDGRFTNRGGRS